MSNLTAYFRVIGDDQPAGAWRPAEVSLEDATGNWFPVEMHGGLLARLSRVCGAASEPPAGPGWTRLDGQIMGPMSGETLKMRVVLARTRRARFASGETLTLSNVPLVGTGRGRC